MKEFVLHYIWQHKLFVQHDMHTTDGQRIEVIDVGKPNTHAGPDFFNAKISIGKTIWAGNVEIHNLASDWNKHGHQQDEKYSNVILHVVKKADVPVFLSDGQKLPQLELNYATEIEVNYESLISSAKWIACADKINMVPEVFIQSWKSALLTERMEQKVTEIKDLLQSNNHHWEEVFFIVLCRSMGFSVNSEAFYLLAKSIPWKVILHNSTSVFQLESLLFGQSGLLENVDYGDDYICRLKKEFEFVKQKYNLQPIETRQWRLLRLRPDNFPFIRIAQLASLLYRQQKLFPNIIQHPEIDILKDVFADIDVSDYWKGHYIPDELSAEKAKRIGQESVRSLLINAVIPVIFCYGEYKQQQHLKDKALSMLDALPAENNHIIRKWKETGMQVNTAADSQSLICLYKKYCEEKKCLRCRIGHKVLTTSFD
jgi:hypothetical protein